MSNFYEILCYLFYFHSWMQAFLCFVMLTHVRWAKQLTWNVSGNDFSQAASVASESSFTVKSTSGACPHKFSNTCANNVSFDYREKTQQWKRHVSPLRLMKHAIHWSLMRPTCDAGKRATIEVSIVRTSHKCYERLQWAVKTLCLLKCVLSAIEF